MMVMMIRRLDNGFGADDILIYLILMVIMMPMVVTNQWSLTDCDTDCIKLMVLMVDRHCM